jgi:hypothetical protein
MVHQAQGAQNISPDSRRGHANSHLGIESGVLQFVFLGMFFNMVGGIGFEPTTSTMST